MLGDNQIGIAVSARCSSPTVKEGSSVLVANRSPPLQSGYCPGFLTLEAANQIYKVIQSRKCSGLRFVVGTIESAGYLCDSISSMKHLAIRPFENSRVPFSNIFVNNRFP